MLTKGDLHGIGKIVKGSEIRVKKEVIFEVTKEIRKVQKKLDDMDNFLDRRDIQNEKRVAIIENKLQIEPAI